MEAPENLVEAVNRIKPRAILVLDTNVVMNNPRLDQYGEKLHTPFVLVVPHVVELELRVLMRGGKNKNTQEKASCALDSLATLYAQGDAATGIELGSRRWLISVSVPKSIDSDAQAEQLIYQKLGNADAALLKLTEICQNEFSDALTVLITEDNLLRLVAILKKQSVYRFSDLQSSSPVEQMLDATRPSKVGDLDISELVDPDEERSVRIALTLEELRSDGDYLIARGSGRLTDGEGRYPFRWTFPYQNLSIYNQLTDEYPESAWHAVMPLENVDFMGVDEEISETVRRYVCRMLEEAYELNDLQSPITKVRSNIMWYAGMGMSFTRGVLYGRPATEGEKQGLTPEEAERYEELRIENDLHMHSLFDGSVKSWGSEYRSVFRLDEAVNKLRGYEIDDEEYGDGWWDLETALIEFLDDALSTWAVGETREEELTYRPFAWPEDEIEAVDDENDLEEEASVDDEDDSEEEFA